MRRQASQSDPPPPFKHTSSISHTPTPTPLGRLGQVLKALVPADQLKGPSMPATGPRVLDGHAPFHDQGGMQLQPLSATAPLKGLEPQQFPCWAVNEAAFERIKPAMLRHLRLRRSLVAAKQAALVGRYQEVRGGPVLGVALDGAS
jgi:hypothetical protein